ncbi:DUF4838 domain-containing protein [Paenibacillus plantarum]|nr:DUF4838 domain-containing protein [Paenibacillus plantarum]
MNPNFAADFSSYFNQQFNTQPLPLDVVTPGSVIVGNKSISQNSNSMALPQQLYAGTISISNVYGTMSIGDPTTVGTTVLYGGSSCTIGATSNLTIYGDVVCNGPITFTGNITGLTIHGNVIAAGSITFNSSVGSFTIDETMSAQGSITFRGSNIAEGVIGGDLIGQGISFNGLTSLSVAGNVSSTLDFMPSSGNYTNFLIGKSLYVTGKSQFSTFNKVVIQGSYYGKGNIDMHNQISSNGLTVGKSMLSNGTIDFHGIGAPVNIGNFLGALNQLNFNSNISGNVRVGGITAGQINIYNNFAPANIFINYNPPTTIPSPSSKIVKSGIANADIIISPSADKLEVLASSELQDTIKMISGADLPIVVGDISSKVSVELQQKELNIKNSGKYPVQFQLLNNTNTSASVDLVNNNNGPITFGDTRGIEILAGQSRTVSSLVYVSQATQDGTYTMPIQVEVDGLQTSSLNLTVNLNRNLLYNGGMEIQNPSSATLPNGWYIPPGFAVLDKEVKHSGNHSLRIDMGTRPYGSVRTDRTDLKLVPGKDYTMIAWVKGTAAGQSVSMQIFEMRLAGGGTVAKTQSFKVDDTWQRIEMKFTPAIDSVSDYNWAYFFVAPPTNTLWIDDVTLVEVEPVSVQLQQSELNVTKSGTYPVQFQLANSSDTPVTLDLAQMDNSVMTLSSITRIELGAHQSKNMDSMLFVPTTVTDGTYTVMVDVKLDGQPLSQMTLTVNMNRNLLYNGGMETQNPSNATLPNGWYIPPGFAVLDNAVKHNGNSSLRIDMGTRPYGSIRTDRTDLKMVPGKDYTMTAWVKGLAAGQKVSMQIYEMRLAGGGTVVKSQSFNVDDRWQRIEMTYTPAINSVSDYNWTYFFVAPPTNTLWIDDVQVSEVEVAPVNVALQQVDHENILDSDSLVHPEEVKILSLTPDDNDRIQIILGTAASYPQLMESYATDLDFLKDSDGFAIRKAGNKIYILGAEPKGVLNGVYDFLEKNADIFWTRSTELGTLYEPKSTIEVTEVNYREKSPFAVRGWHLTGTGENGDIHSDLETEKLMARNKLNAKFAETSNMQLWQRYENTGLRAVNLGHNLGFWLPNALYFADHPEYYSTDLSGNPVPVANDTQINFYNEDVPVIIAGRVKEFLKTQSIEYVGIGINDTHNFNMGNLSSQPFETVDGIIVQPEDPAYKSTVFFTFLNKVAAQVKVSNPGVKIVTYAYFFTDVPPKVELEDNIVIVMAPANEDGRTPLNSNDINNPNYGYKLKLEEWTTKTKNIVMYNYYGCCYTHAYERPMAEKVQADMKYYRELGIMGVIPEGSVDYGIVDTLGMNRFKGVAPSWGVNALQFWLYHKLFWNPDADLEKLTNEFMTKAYGNAAIPMKKYYDLIKQGWNHDQQVINFYSGESQLIGNYIMKAGIKDAAQSALNEAWLLANEMERGRIEPIKKTFEVMTYLIGDRPVLSANAVKTTASKAEILQTLDFSKGPWTNAEPFNDFKVMKTMEQVSAETKVHLLWDDENLYVGYENYDSDLSKMIVSDSAPGSWWSSGADDSVETYITGDIQGDYYAFFTNPKSVQFAYKKGVIPSPGTLFETNANIGTDRWNSIQVIPFSSIGVDINETDTLMGFFFRNYHGTKGLYGWGGGSVWNSSDFGPIHLITKN